MKRSIDYLSWSQVLWPAIISIFWSLGIVTGISVSMFACPDVLALAKFAPVTSPSVAALVLIRSALFLLSVVLLRYCRLLFFALILAVSFSFGCIISFFVLAFQSAGWIVILLVLTPDALLLVLLTFYVLSRDPKWFCSVKGNFFIPFILICAVSIIECYYTAPFSLALF